MAVGARVAAMTYADRLEAAVAAKQSPCLVGLDPHLDLLPPEFTAAHDPAASRAEVARAVGDFLVEVIGLVAEYTPVVKPQSAFFEALGAEPIQPGVGKPGRVVTNAMNGIYPDGGQRGHRIMQFRGSSG